MNWLAGSLSGVPVQRSQKHLGDVRRLFAGLASPLADKTLLYSVEWFGTAAPGVEGALLFGCTRLEPGKVGDEYFMTHGHFHANPTRAEIYFCASGSGLLLLMDRSGRTWSEPMSPGSVHSIDGRHAHRVVNIGDVPLIFWASWPADAGYDYDSILRGGFGLRVVERNGAPVIIDSPNLQEAE